MALEQEFGNGYLIPWGWITHSESVSIEHSKIGAGTSVEIYRRRGYTHTLTINGSLQYSNTWGTMRTQKDRLTEYIESMKTNPENFGLPINAGFYPSIPINPSNVVFEPVSLNWEPGVLLDQQKYSVSFVFKIYPDDTEIGEMDTALGIKLWDGSNYSVSLNWDRAKKRTVKTVSISASIKCPDQMSWKKALEYYESVASLSDHVGDAIIGTLQYDKNYDQQSVSYSIGFELIGDGDEGDADATIKLFGFLWSIHGSLQISSDTSKVEVSLSTPDSKVVANTALPNVEVLNYTLSVTAPNDVGLVSPNEMPGLGPVTLLDMYANARSIKQGQYLKGLESATTENTDWVIIADPDPTKLWEITTVSSSFDPLNKSLSVNISARRARDVVIRKDLGFANQTAFLWSGSQMSYSRNSDLTSFIFSSTVTANANIQVPNDMTAIQAQELIDEVMALPQFDSSRYRGYKLISKQGNFDRITQTGTYSLQFQQIDLYSFFDDVGNVRSPRPCLWDYNIFQDIVGLQMDVRYNERASLDTNNVLVNELTVDINMRQNPDEYVQRASSIESVFTQLWTKFKVNKESIGDPTYRLSAISKNFDSNTLTGQMSLTFTDDGDNSENSGAFVQFYGIIISDPKYSFKFPTMRFSEFTDGYTNGDYAQKQGMDMCIISLSGRVKFKHYDTITPPKNVLQSSSDYKEGYLIIAGYKGRIQEISIDPDPKNRTADVRFSIKVQPTDANGNIIIPEFDDDTLQAVPYTELEA